nr:immunoglobulin light chain junction region [Macaca mulatta]
CQHYNSAPLTF